MHIALAILGALGAIGIIVWRISLAIQGARVIGEAAGEVANLPRKMRFRSKANRKGLAMVDDPREAAAILLLGAARAGGEVTLEDKTAIRAEVARRFEMSDGEAEELLARAAWVSSALHNPEDGIARMTQLIAQRLSARELGELAAMLEVVAATGGTVSPSQEAYLAQYRHRAGLA